MRSQSILLAAEDTPFPPFPRGKYTWVNPSQLKVCQGLVGEEWALGAPTSARLRRHFMWKLFLGVSLVTGKDVPPADCSSQPEKCHSKKPPASLVPTSARYLFSCDQWPGRFVHLDLHKLAWKRKRKASRKSKQICLSNEQIGRDIPAATFHSFLTAYWVSSWQRFFPILAWNYKD